MSIETEINRISANVSETLSAVSEMGGEVPEGAKSDDMASGVRSIPVGAKIDDTEPSSTTTYSSQKIEAVVSELKNNKLDKTATAADSSKLGGMTPKQLMLALYPVGSVYISTVSTSPAELFGGDWERINGRFLIGAGAPELNDDGTSPGDYNFAAGAKGGEATHTLAVNEMPKHRHGLSSIGWGGESSVDISPHGVYLAFDPSGNQPLTYNYFYESGGGEEHNNMTPYLAVYMWKRVS